MDATLEKLINFSKAVNHTRERKKTGKSHCFPFQNIEVCLTKEILSFIPSFSHVFHNYTHYTLTETKFEDV